MPPATTFASLPDDLIAAVLGQLEAVERYTTAALVCRRWHQLLVSWPELHPSSLCLRTADVARFHSLRAWLLRHSAAGSLKRLSIFFENCTISKVVTARLRTAIAGLMPACAAGLTELVLETDSLSLVIGAWVEGMRQLTRLQTSAYFLAAAANMRGLTALADLRVDSGVLNFNSLRALPPSLTRLELAARDDLLDQVPRQVSSLTRLHTLHLNIACDDLSSYSMLTALSSLRRLELKGQCEVPPCLSQLTGLTRLAINNRESHVAIEHTVLAALPQLSRLQHLALVYAIDAAGLAAVLERLNALSSLCWKGKIGDDVLPAGAWLGRLRRLAADVLVLRASLPVLAAATQLTYLGVNYGPCPARLHDLEPLAQLPSLCHVAVAHGARDNAAMLAFAAANPALRVARGESVLEGAGPEPW